MGRQGGALISCLLLGASDPNQDGEAPEAVGRAINGRQVIDLRDRRPSRPSTDAAWPGNVFGHALPGDHQRAALLPSNPLPLPKH